MTTVPDPTPPASPEPGPVGPAVGSAAGSALDDTLPVGAVLVADGADHDEADDDGAGGAGADDRDHGGGPAEWGWVREWRASAEPVPWARGVALALFTLVLVASAIFVLTAGVADTPWLALVLNVVVACGIGPQLWLARNIPVIRFIVWGAALGVPVGWLACFVVPFPT